MMSLKYEIIGVVLIAAISFSAGKFGSKAEVQVKTVEKVVYKESTELKKDVDQVQTTKETRYPNGTVVKETTTKTQSETEKETDKSLNKDTEKVSTTENRPDWRVGLTYFPTIPAWQKQSASVSIEKRFLGEFYFGPSITTQQTIGFSFSYGF